MSEKKIATRLIQSGEHKMAAKLAAARSYPKTLPIYLSSVFAFDDVEALEAAYADADAGYIYSRMGNPSHEAVCNLLASAEGDETQALVASSGMAAIILTILSSVSAGDHVLATPVLYGGVYDYLKNELPRFGVQVDFVDPLHDDVEKAFRPNTKLLYTETITNPLMEVFDLDVLADIAHRHGALLVVDNTFATAAVCRPLRLGADISVYSATKYLCGHSDLTGGAILASPERIAHIRRYNTLYGTMLSAFDAWLLARSLRTLELRMRRHSENAMCLAEYFARQPAITKVHYPGLATSAFHQAASRQFLDQQYGGMLSIDFADGVPAADAFIAHCEEIKLVPSLAGVSTSISYPQRTSHRAYSAAELQQAGIAPGQLRISAGLEQVEDLIAEFTRAFAKL